MTDAQSDQQGETPTETAAQATPSETVTSETVRVRRTPRYARFMLVGALVCVVAAFIVTYSFPQGAGYDRNTVFGFMLLVAIAVGVALGALAALIADRIARKQARTVTADRIDVRTPPADAPSRPDDAG
jgi:H+/Cl- antiporter ClcA